MLKDQLNEDQLNIFNEVITWFNGGCNGDIIIGGYAGTGKTFLLTAIYEEIKKHVGKEVIAFCAYTGKAASVLNKYLIERDLLRDSDYVGTIHSLMYFPITEEDEKGNKKIVGWKKHPQLRYSPTILFVDEASMLSHELYRDLLSYGVPMILSGDNFQLPPIDDSFDIMSMANFKLTKIQRQAEDSEIIKLSMNIRRYGFIPMKKYSNDVYKGSWFDPKVQNLFNNIDLSSENMTVLCGFNRTRNDINMTYRRKTKKRDDIIYPKDKIICLVNNQNTNLKNGQQGIVEYVMPHSNHFFRLTLSLDIMPDYYETLAFKHSFGQENHQSVFDNKDFKVQKSFQNFDIFDFAYAMSVHKAQASEWDRIILIEQRSKHWDDIYYARWLYTGVTRAKKKLFIIQDYF